MMKVISPAMTLLGGLLLAVPLGVAEEIRFGRDVLPLLSDNCFACHGPDAASRQADLRLDEPFDEALAEEVLRRVTSDDPAERMPPAEANRQLNGEQIAILRRWVEEGAKWGTHWALEPVTRPALPQPARFGDRRQNGIDAFILDRLEQEGLAPSPQASRETLLRRVALDLTGLPPSPEDAESFLNDASPEAYERLVDRLLSSPTFGERMAWSWLDAARYADSNGYQGDAERTMWPWRDWVTDAFNRNLPYDRFTVWQLAGDLLPDATPEQKLATGFNRNHMINGEGGRIAEENRAEYVMDMTETMGAVWLGLTLTCCRCHDHKFDPLPQRDYYSLFAFFNQTPVNGGGGNPQTPPVLEAPTEEQQARRAELEAAVKSAVQEVEELEKTFFPREEGQTADQSEKANDLPENLKAILKKPPAGRDAGQLGDLAKHWQEDAPEYAALIKELRKAREIRDGLASDIPRVMVMEDMAQPRETFILTKGLYNQPGEKVTADVPEVLPPLPDEAPRNRLGLAQWLMSPEHPLTARVTVNRFWQQFFGVGLVKTPEDFGVQGQKPSHPELLDWLAAEFVESGWDVKHLCRLIVTSAAYRQSSQVSAELLERDPENRLLARGPRFRMPSWMIRDQALAASGLLVRRLGGAPVKPYQPEGVWAEATFGKKRYVQDKGEDLYRRSLYTFWRRIIGPTMFFDTASRQVCTVSQVRTNTPLHALATLNDVTYVEAARALAERVLTTAGPDPRERIELAYRLLLARSPGDEELAVLLASLKRVERQFAADPESTRRLLELGDSQRNESLDAIEHAAYTAVCNALLNLDETLTKE